MRRDRWSWVVLLCLASCNCDPEADNECVYNASHHSVGEVFAAGDGCNHCVCGADGTVTCTQSVCQPPGDAGLPADAAADANSDGGSADAGSNPNVVVPIPDSACAVVSVNGATPSGTIVPGDVVVVSAASYPAPTAGARVTQLSWTLARMPAGARAVLAPRDDVETTLRETAVVGTYVLRTALVDDSGGTADRDCKLEVRPPHSLYVELIWDRASTDLDLHAIKGDAEGRYCHSAHDLPFNGLAQSCDSNLACYYGNCKLISGTPPIWDSSSASHSGGNPTLVIDDLDGFGPEVIQTEQVVAGSYLVGVFFFGGVSEEATAATVNLYLYGQLRGRASRSIQHHEWWEPFVIAWPTSGDVCVSDPAVDTPATCHPAPQCTPPASCAQCADTSACGPGTHCEAQRCRPDLTICLNDEACTADQRCLTATDVCGDPGCSVTPCDDPRQVCSTDVYACYLPPAVCVETDEPNDDPAHAAELGTAPLSSLLCRGDVDVLRLSGQSATYLHVEVTVAGEDPNSVKLELLDPSLEVVASGSGRYSNPATLAAPVVTAGSYYLVLRSDSGQVDQWSYTVTASALPMLAICQDDPGEPNDSLEQAGSLQLAAGQHELALCRHDDFDHYQLVVPSLTLLEVSVTFNHLEGDIGIDLYASSAEHIVRSNGSGDGEYVSYGNFGETASTLTLRVSRSSGSTLDQQVYTVTVGTQTLQLLPVCIDEAGEPNDSLAQAGNSVLLPGEHQRGLCSRQDQDFHALIAPPWSVLTVSASYSHHEGSIWLELADTSGQSVGMTYTGGNGHEERWAEFANRSASDVALVARVWRYLYGDWTEQQPYSIEVRAVALAPCDDGWEPNDTRELARVITAQTLQAVACDANDRDYFLVDLPRGGDLAVDLDHAAGPGDLDLYLWDAFGRLIAASATSGTTEHVERTGLPGSMVTVEVRPYGTAVAAERYQLTLGISNVPDAGPPEGGTYDAIGPVDAAIPDALVLDAAGG